MLPKLIITDIDGVWTDGGMYYTEDGNEFKKFNTADSFGILLCKLYSIKTAIITGEKNNIVLRRAEKLNVDFLFMGIKNKLKTAQNLLKQENLSWENTAYIGDSIADLPLLKKTCYSGTPNSAPEYIKNKVKIITLKNGGEGAFKEFVETIFLKEGILQEALKNAEQFYLTE